MDNPVSYSDLTWLGSDRPMARRLGRPAARFLQIEASGGVVLLLATAVALIWANSGWSDSYHELFESEIELHIGGVDVFARNGLEHFTLEEFINDALMAVFFFVVGIEIKRELVTGQLRNPRDAALPAIAALGGMVVPALLYFAVNTDGEAARGWGIPMATDIAFAVGIVSLLGSRIPRSLRVFLLTLAIVDDIGAILVIAVFYTDSLSAGWLFAALALLLASVFLRQIRVWYAPIYVVIAVFVWWATFKSGVHATVAGVALGLLVPARPLQTEGQAREIASWLRDKDEVFPVDVRWAGFHIRESRSVAERLEFALHPVSSFLIIPVFALANAGVSLGGDALSDAASSTVTLGVMLGLVVGKTFGVAAATIAAARLGVARLPRGMSPMHVVGLGMVAGIGFTVSIFISGLAFSDPAIEDQAKIGILFASFIAAGGGLALLSRVSPPAVVSEVAVVAEAPGSVASPEPQPS